MTDNWMISMKKEQTEKLIFSFVSVAFFWIAAHGYRFMNNLYTSDSLVCVFQDDIYWQRSLGRYLQTAVLVLRGSITAPWLIGIIGMAFFTAAVYLVQDILCTNRLVTFIISGILICNADWTSSVAGFLPWVDIYSAAFFLATLCVWFYRKDCIKGYISGSIALICSLALYQAYVDVALGLVVIMAILELADGKEDVKKSLVKIFKMGGCLFASAVCYYLSYNLVNKIHHVSFSTGHNSIAGVGKYSGISIGELVIGTYTSFFERMWTPDKFVSTYLLGKSITDCWTILLRAGFVISLVMLVAGLVFLNIKNRTTIFSKLLQFFGMLLFPFAINFVYFMSKGIEHDLMIFSFFLVYVFAVVVAGKSVVEADRRKCISWICIIPFVLLLWNNIVYSNQVYFKLDMEGKASISKVTRLVDDIEAVEGYKRGVTSIRFIGGLERAAKPIPYLERVYVNGNNNTPFNYDIISLRAYINLYLGVDMNISNDEWEDDGISDMLTAYPEKGSMMLDGDILYVKLSD